LKVVGAIQAGNKPNVFVVGFFSLVGEAVSAFNVLDGKKGFSGFDILGGILKHLVLLTEAVLSVVTDT